MIKSIDIDNQFFILKKCKNKFDYLMQEMLLIGELTPSVNVHLDSIRAKLFDCVKLSDKYIIIYDYVNLQRTISDSYFNHFELKNGIAMILKCHSI